MFNALTNSRANRFNGKLPPAPDPLKQTFVNEEWLFGLRRRKGTDRFAGVKRIGRGPSWRKGSRFDNGDTWRRVLDRNDRARVMARSNETPGFHA